MTGVIRGADRKTQREGSYGKMETKVRIMHPHPRECQLPPEAKREACNGSPSEPQKKPTLLTLWLQTSVLHNGERIHCCGLKLPSLWSFVIETLRNAQSGAQSSCKNQHPACRLPHHRAAPSMWVAWGNKGMDVALAVFNKILNKGTGECVWAG